MLPIAIAMGIALCVAVLLMLLALGVHRDDRAGLASRPATPLAALTRRVVGLYMRKPIPHDRGGFFTNGT